MELWSGEISVEVLREIAVFHLVLDAELRVVSFGMLAPKIIPEISVGADLSSLVISLQENVPINYEFYESFGGSVLFEVRSSAVKIKGQMIVLEDGYLFFHGEPWVRDLRDMYALDLMLTDMPPWEPLGDFLKLFQRQHSALEDANELTVKLREQENMLLEQNRSLEETNELLIQAREMIQRQQKEFNKFSLIAARTDNAVIITNVEGTVEWVNAGFVKLYGYSFEEMLGKNPYDFLSGSGTSVETLDRIREMLELEQGFSEELLSYSKTGQIVWVLVQCQPILDSNREVTGFLAIQSNITDRRRRLEEIRLQRDKLDTTIRCIGDAVMTIGEDGVIDVANDAAASLVGLSLSDVSGSHVDSLFEVYDQSGEQIKYSQFLEDDCVTSSPISDGENWFELKGRDGVDRKIAHSAVVIQMPQNKRELLLVIRDLTKSMEFDRIKRDFVATVSHELRTPLTSLKGFVALLRRNQNLNEETRSECLEIIEQQTERLVRLVNDILEFSRLENKGLEFRPRPQSVPALVRSSCVAVQGLCDQYRVSLRSQLEEGLPLLLCDPDKMESVLTNVLSNAVKFSPPGSEVLIEVQLRDDELRFCVTDRGVGIPEGDLDKIFDRFHRVEGVSQLVPGTGLGLSIVKKVVDLHGGTLSVTSKLNEGSTFEIRMPIGL